MIWDIIEQKLEAAGLATDGKDLFWDNFPAEVAKGVMLKTPLQGIDIDWHMPGYYKTKLQLIVRHPSPVEGEAFATAVMNCLIVQAPEHYEPTPTRGRAQLNLLLPAQLPIKFPRLEGNGLEWSLNFMTSVAIQPL
jgi:hypothetical protein